MYRLYSVRRTIETDGYTNTPNGWKVCLEDGTYTLSAWVMTNAAQKVNQLYAKNYGGDELTQTLPVSDLGWNKVVIDNIQVTNGQCEIKVYSIANGGDWCNIDNIMLRKK